MTGVDTDRAPVEGKIEPHRVNVEGGKYTFVSDVRDVNVVILRHGKPWHEQSAAGNALRSIMAELDAARVVMKAAREFDSLTNLKCALALHDRLVDDRDPPSTWAQPSLISAKSDPASKHVPTIRKLGGLVMLMGCSCGWRRSSSSFDARDSDDAYAMHAAEVGAAVVEEPPSEVEPIAPNAWLLLALDRALPALKGAARDKIAFAILKALPADELVREISSAAKTVLAQRNIRDEAGDMSNEIASNATQMLLFGVMSASRAGNGR